MTEEALLVELPVRPESAGSAREALAGFRSHLDSGTYLDLRWVISELVADAVRTGADGEDLVRVRISIDDHHIEVTVGDGASAYKLRSRRPGFGEPGWGMHLARILGSSWGTRHEADQGSVWVRAPLSASPGARLSG